MKRAASAPSAKMAGQNQSEAPDARPGTAIPVAISTTASADQSRRASRIARASLYLTVRYVRTLSERPLALFDLIGLDEIAGLDVGGVLEGDAAFEAGADFGDVVLEAPEGCDRPVVDDHVVAHDPGLQCLADIAFGDEQARRLAVLARREDLADLGAADHGLDDQG